MLDRDGAREIEMVAGKTGRERVLHRGTEQGMERQYEKDSKIEREIEGKRERERERAHLATRMVIMVCLISSSLIFMSDLCLF